MKPLPKKIHLLYYFPDHPEFKPNISPIDILKQGSFGGTYFRPIYSSVTKKDYKNRYLKCFPKPIINSYNFKNDTKPYSEYDKSHNKYNIKCGQTLKDWENKNWITEHDPYGWFEWYCNFFYGRRILNEDDRQIKRWLGLASEKGRFRNHLITLILKKNANYNDFTVSPKIRQTLLHWGYELTKKDFEKRKKLI